MRTSLQCQPHFFGFAARFRHQLSGTLRHCFMEENWNDAVESFGTVESAEISIVHMMSISAILFFLYK